MKRDVGVEILVLGVVAAALVLAAVFDPYLTTPANLLAGAAMAAASALVFRFWWRKRGEAA